MFKKTLLLTLFLIFGIVGLSIVKAQESTSSSDSVREKVKEKIQEVLNNPKAYLGTVTGKTGDTLQIKNLEGEIKFISIDTENISVVNVGKTSTSIKFDDIALGDFIISMGYLNKGTEEKETNGNTVLEAKRILVTEEIKPTERKSLFGNVVKIESKTLFLSTPEGEQQFEFPKTWKGPEIDEISENDRMAVVSIPDSGKTYIRTIEIISNSPASEEE